ncbi:MAG TPA: glutaredoxin domain-containing protein [Anaerolineales bacterium]|nr:glutaredoxin domain-containing protein [Anaerolineales bacterium]
MDNETIQVFGVGWCGDCLRTQRFLNQNGVAYRWIDIDRDAAGEQFVLRANRGMRSVPTIRFPDGSLLVEPSNAILAVKIRQAELA